MIKQSIDAAQKMSTLEWAITNAEIEEFTYYESGDGRYYSQRKSSDLVERILIGFRQGRYCDISQFIKENIYSQTDINHSKQLFRQALKSQIYDLTGVMPRFVFKTNKNGDDDVTIHYS